MCFLLSESLFQLAYAGLNELAPLRALYAEMIEGGTKPTIATHYIRLQVCICVCLYFTSLHISVCLCVCARVPCSPCRTGACARSLCGDDCGWHKAHDNDRHALYPPSGMHVDDILFFFFLSFCGCLLMHACTCLRVLLCVLVCVCQLALVRALYAEMIEGGTKPTNDTHYIRLHPALIPPCAALVHACACVLLVARAYFISAYYGHLLKKPP